MGARSFLVLDGSSAPVTGAAGSFTAIARTRAGLVRTAPPMVELGVGLYEIQPTAADEAEGVIVLVDVGAGRLVRRFCFAVYRPDAVNQFFAFVLETAAGALWAGAPPTIPAGGFRSAAGVRTAPALVAAIDPYLWSATPTAADVEAGSSIRIDAPAGAAASYFFGYTDRMGLAPGAANPLNPPRTGGFLRSSPGVVKRRPS